MKVIGMGRKLWSVITSKTIFEPHEYTNFCSRFFFCYFCQIIVYHRQQDLAETKTKQHTGFTAETILFLLGCHGDFFFFSFLFSMTDKLWQTSVGCFHSNLTRVRRVHWVLLSLLVTSDLHLYYFMLNSAIWVCLRSAYTRGYTRSQHAWHTHMNFGQPVLLSNSCGNYTVCMYVCTCVLLT